MTDAAPQQATYRTLDSGALLVTLPNGAQIQVSREIERLKDGDGPPVPASLTFGWERGG